MNSIEFLISLKDINNYLRTIHPDLEMLIECFTPEMFNTSFSKFPFKGETFLEQVEIDLKTASSEQLITLADFIQKYFKFYTQKYPLLNVLRKRILEFFLMHPESFSLKEYFPILVEAITDRISNNLEYPINLSYLEHKPQEAQTHFDGFTHSLEVSYPSLTKNNNIYEIFNSLYHEQYHMIVNELIRNPNCYKINILEYAIVKAVMQCVNDKKIEEFYYEDLKEENNAFLYGIKKAKEEILKLNPNFKVYSKWVALKESYFQASSANNYIKGSNTENQIDFFENILDHILLKHPEENQGILNKVYNKDGTKKDFYSLLEDFSNALTKLPKNFHGDIKHFYSYLFFRSLKSMPENDRLVILKNPVYTNTLFSCLEDYKRELLLQKSKINSYHIYTLSNKYKRNKTLKFMEEDIKKMEEMESHLVKKENVEYERK